MSTFTFDDLISWSAGLPEWQRDALRRVLTSGVTADDVAALAAIVKGAHGFGAATSPQPADSSHAPSSGFSLPPVVIRTVRDIQHANALAPGPVTFAPQGLSIVYGENASGKSGLTRIFKKACRARNPGGPIRSHVFEPEPSSPASATIEFSVGAVDRSVAWVDGAPSDDDLARVTVCDASCATLQIERANQLTYTPEILRCFTGLADVCRAVATQLREERGTLEALRRPELATLALRPETSAGTLIRALSKDTDISRVSSICELNEEHRTRQQELVRALQDDGTAQISLLDTRARRLRDLDEALTHLEQGLSDTAVAAFEVKLSHANATRETATVARAAFASNSAIYGLGTDPWRQMWESARRYSEAHAFPGHPFPATHDDALCVLCQQSLSAAARQRMTAFESFVQNDVQQRADAAQRDLRTAIARIESLTCALSGALLRDAGLHGTTSGLALKAFIVRAKLRRRLLLRRARGGDGASASLPDRPTLTAIRSEVSAEVGRLRAAAQAAERQAMQRELNELNDRFKLAPLRDIVIAEIERLQRVDMLTRAIGDCDTARITRKEGEAARAIVTARLRSAFQQNLAQLGFGAGPPVEVTLGAGDVGRHPYQLALVARADVPPGEILSEGERTCVALAGFLAELDTANNRSAIILDDPVSSLDHRYRQNVARRLVEAARERQVVVFTHDIVFLLMLTKYARAGGVAVHELNLHRGSSRHGLPEEGPPWIAMPVNKCIGVLRRELQSARVLLNGGDRPTYEQKAEWIYKRLRQAWERAVEEVLLNGVVVRFGDGVSTQRLRLLTDIDQTDIQTVETEMTYCSSFVHDESGAVNAGIPDPVTVDADIRRLEDWVGVVRRRR